MPRAALGPLFALLAVMAPTFAHADDLTREERRIVEWIDAHNEEAISFLERVVNIASPTQDLAGVREVGKAFRAEFDRLGFETRWEEMPAEMHRAGHLIAELKGTEGKRLLLIGHLDTVLSGRKFERDGSRAKGPGTEDMKGGDVIVLQALKALNAAGALKGRRIVVLFTGDEEDAGMPIEASRKSMREAASRSDLALAFEGGIDDTATVARRGASTWKLEVSAKTGHSAGILREEAGAGAIFEAARILDAFRREVPERYLTINPSVMVGGTTAKYDSPEKSGSAEGKTNVIPATVVIEGDLRFISEEQKQRARGLMRQIAARNLPKASAKITFADEYPAMSPREGNYKILAVLDGASRDLGLGAVKALDPGRRGAGDISFVPMLDGLDGLGAKGEGAHTTEEWIDLDTFAPQTKKAALLIHRLTRP